MLRALISAAVGYHSTCLHDIIHFNVNMNQIIMFINQNVPISFRNLRRPNGSMTKYTYKHDAFENIHLIFNNLLLYISFS